MKVSLRDNALAPVVVDDTGLSYSGTWQSGGVGSEYNGTTHGTRTPGSIATFQFSGTSISVFGTVGLNNLLGNPVSSYTVDGTDAAMYNGPVATQVAYHQVFYQSPTLDNGPHTLSIQLVSFSPSPNVTGGDPLLWIDYIVYTPFEAAEVTPSSSSSSSQSSPVTSEVAAPSLNPPPSKATTSSSAFPVVPPLPSSADSVSSRSPSGPTAPSSFFMSTSSSGFTTSGSDMPSSWATSAKPTSDVSTASTDISESSTVLVASQSTLPSSASAPLVSHSDRHVGLGVIVGVAVSASIAVLLIAVCLTIMLRRRRRSNQPQMLMVQNRDGSSITHEPAAYTYTNSLISPDSESASPAQLARAFDTHAGIFGNGRLTAASLSSYSTSVIEKSGLPRYDAVGEAEGDVLLARGGSQRSPRHERQQPPAYGSHD